MRGMEEVSHLIEKYELVPHPEGGWYREVHRSVRSVGQLPGYPGERSAVTAIYFLLEYGDFSAFHRVRSEEVWIHLAGDPLELVLLDAAPRMLVLSSAAGPGEPLIVVTPGILQAARPVGAFTLAACLVAPGFDFADFAMPTREELTREFPYYAPLIRTLTRSDVPSTPHG